MLDAFHSLNPSVCALDSSNGQVLLITPQKRKKRKDRSAKDEAEGKEEYRNLHKVLAESNECMKDSTRKMMGMDIAAAIRELRTKIEEYEDKLDDLGTDEDVVASVKYQRILDRKEKAIDEMNVLKTKLEQYE